jgi:hypothetical protein
MRGIYVLADDSIEDLFLACVHSLMCVEPGICICIIPFNANCFKIKQHAMRLGLINWSDEALLRQCDTLSMLFHSCPSGTYRKLAMWNGIFDEFIYVDSDMIVLQKLTPLFSLLSAWDIVVAVSDLPQLKRFVWNDNATAFNEKIDTEYSANTGFIISKRGVLEQSQIIHLAKQAQRYKTGMALECAEQPVLNYIIVSSGRRYTSLSARRRSGEMMPREMWGGDPEWSGRLVDCSEPPLLIHWAGVWRDGLHLRSRLWQHFRCLQVPPQ